MSTTSGPTGPSGSPGLNGCNCGCHTTATFSTGSTTSTTGFVYTIPQVPIESKVETLRILVQSLTYGGTNMSTDVKIAIETRIKELLTELR